MVSVQEALNVVLNAAVQRPIIKVDLAESEGMVLAEDVYADRDFPPFDRVCMDGICIHSDALKDGDTIFELKGMAAAGMPRMNFQGKGSAIEVMTGAILPEGYNIVIPFEEIDTVENEARLLRPDWKEGANIHKKGRDRKKGSLLIPKGTKIEAPEIGVIATVGLSTIAVYKAFNIAIVSTGDELVGIDEMPASYQIRTSNSIQLASVLKREGHTTRCFHINDDQKKLEQDLGRIMDEYDMLILSGGVSRGKLDFVPAVLESLQVEKLFHRVAQKPGKPFWFGTKGDTPVFAFPGNPVSSFLCLHKYALPFMHKCMTLPLSPQSYAVLEESVSFKKPLTYFPTVELFYKNGVLHANLKPGQGSGDLSNLMNNNAFVELDATLSEIGKGALLPVIRYR